MKIISKKKKVERKDLYSAINEFNEYFYVCYKNFKRSDREIYGTIIANKSIQLISYMSEVYFSFESDKNKIFNKMFLLLKDIEFQIRNCYRCKMISKKQITNLQKVLSNIDLYIKELNKENV